ncbi:hypothetical protein B0H10DRAFT_1996587 [Mycena sp. CBHHK59/15]|nr:hypothetical protein B0H10DRAFT_2068433 [Mycena sp. CBHHK59/15]KAJ6626793.1 hypothetical protein B0H10DRAFT_1996587 [Mycena sp. CBHHK59/15]
MADDFIASLHLPESFSDEDVSEAVAALILSATDDENPAISLEQIYRGLCQSRIESLDPLSTLPHLLPSRADAAKELISYIGEHGSPKEIVIAVQEVLERVESAFNVEAGDGEEANTASPPDQLISLILLYNLAIPRLKLRKKSPSETIRPLLSQLESTIQLAGPQLDRDQGREIISATAKLTFNFFSWATGVNPDDAVPCKEILSRLLDCSITAFSHCIRSSLAQRSFETLFPRLTIRSTVEPGWEAGEKAVSDALAAYSSLGRTFELDSLPPVPSTSYLILLSHSKILPSDTGRLLSFMLPILMASIQTNSALDESMSLLLQALHAAHFKAGQQLSPDISVPLCVLLPSLASTHPDSDIRHQAFRILSRVLSLTPAELRLQILKDLTCDTDLPQMRVAAIGLVKEASLEFLSHEGTPSIFASPMFLQVLGPVLLRPDPVDLFHSNLSLSEIQDSSEPARLVECLALYYILLLRDQLNKTGIRDRDQISNVEKTLLSPLRSTISRWMEDPNLENNHIHAIMPLVSLKTSLERVDAAIAGLRSESAI